MDQDAPRILILEDEIELREALSSLLEDEGYRVEGASNATEALEKATMLEPEIMVLDVRLPGPDGLEVLKQLKTVHPELLSLVITGYASEADSIRAIRLGVGDYLRKPFATSDFLQSLEGLVRVMLRRRALKRQTEASRRLALWTLRHLAAGQELSPVQKGLSWRAAGEQAAQVALRMNFSRGVAQNIEAALLFTLLSEGDELSEHREVLAETLPAEVLHLTRSLQTEGAEELAGPEGIAQYAIHLTRGEQHPAPHVASDVSVAFGEHPDGPGSLPTVGSGTLLGLVRTFLASGDEAAAEETLAQLISERASTRAAAQGILLMATAQKKCKNKLKKSLSQLAKMLPGLGSHVEAELGLEAGLLAVESGFTQGKELLRKSGKKLEQLGMVSLLAKAELALWCLKEADESTRDQALEEIASPHRLDLLSTCAPWLLPALLRRLPDLDTALHRRVVQRLVRDNPSVVTRFLKSCQDSVPLQNLLEALADGGSSAQPLVSELTSPRYPGMVRQKAKNVLAALGGRQVYHLRFSSLGNFEVAAGEKVDSPGAWRTQKCRFLLACLVARRNHPLPKEVLAEQFWPDSSQRRSLKNLYQAVSDIRKVFRTELGIEGEVFERSGAQLALNPELECWHDLEEFERALESGKTHWQQGDKGRSREAWKEAVRLYRGPYLQECTLEWALTTQRHYQLQMEQVLENLSAACLELNFPLETVEFSQRLLEWDPCHQNAHNLIMEAYIQEGRPEEAVRQHDRLSRLLQMEFQSEPSIDLMRTLQKAKMMM
jgi:two-component SAPR family response regulator